MSSAELQAAADHHKVRNPTLASPQGHVALCHLSRVHRCKKTCQESVENIVPKIRHFKDDIVHSFFVMPLASISFDKQDPFRLRSLPFLPHHLCFKLVMQFARAQQHAYNLHVTLSDMKEDNYLVDTSTWDLKICDAGAYSFRPPQEAHVYAQQRQKLFWRFRAAHLP